MRRVIVVLLVLGIAGRAAYQNRLELMLWAAPRLADLRDPIAPNRAVAWDQGPAEPVRPPADRPPNVVLILADDMGFNDVSFFNGGAGDGSVMTPRIDSIAHDGIVFTSGYAANAVCAPSRASIMTGRYATRFGFEFTPFPRIGVTILEMMNDSDPSPLQPVLHHERLDALPDMDFLGMPPEEITIGELLEDAGYYTAHIGKWHLGGGRRDATGESGLRQQPVHGRAVVSARGFPGRGECEAGLRPDRPDGVGIGSLCGAVRRQPQLRARRLSHRLLHRAGAQGDRGQPKPAVPALSGALGNPQPAAGEAGGLRGARAHRGSSAQGLFRDDHGARSRDRTCARRAGRTRPCRKYARHLHERQRGRRLSRASTRQ